ncbi:MAG: UbiA family prenyltransferase [Dehalococcoidia bacterium]
MHRLLVAARVIHLFPTLANTLATALFAAIASRGAPPAGATVRLALVMFGTQCAIGAANDAVDVDLDRPSKPWKPIVRGAISRQTAWIIAALAALAACVLAATFGPAAWLLAMAGLACGLAYDLGLKRTAFSVLPYLIALPLIPLWIWTALDRFSPTLLWEYPLGTLIGLSLYLGNTAPDIESDAASGVRGLAHRLGLMRTLALAWVALAAALALGTAIAVGSGFDAAWLLAGVAGGSLGLLAAVGLSLWQQSEAGLRRAWGLLVAASLLFGLGWLASVR